MDHRFFLPLLLRVFRQISCVCRVCYSIHFFVSCPCCMLLSIVRRATAVKISDSVAKCLLCLLQESNDAENEKNQGAKIMQIEQRPLGASGLIVPALGIGTMSWGERLMGYGKTHTHQDVNEAYRACLDAGLTFFDSAEGYGFGENERLLGALHKQDGRAATIATKYAP